MSKFTVSTICLYEHKVLDQSIQDQPTPKESFVHHMMDGDLTDQTTVDEVIKMFEHTSKTHKSGSVVVNMEESIVVITPL